MPSGSTICAPGMWSSRPVRPAAGGPTSTPGCCSTDGRRTPGCSTSSASFAAAAALELARNPLELLCPVLHARGVVGSERWRRRRRTGVRRSFEKCNPGLGLIAGAPQLVELALQRADLRRVDERREAEGRRLLQLPNPSFELRDRALGQIELVAQRPEALLLGRIEQTLPGDPGLAGDIGEPAREIGDHRRRLERCSGQVGRDHLGKRVQLGPGPLGVPHQVLVEHDAEVTRPLAHRRSGRPRPARP